MTLINNTRRSVAIIMIAAALVLAAMTASLLAQERTARVFGTVRDPSGGVVPGVTVSLINTETGVTSEWIANESGIYNAPRILTGPYRLEVEQPGFKKFVRQGLLFVPGDQVEINVPLEVGERTETVVVTSQAPLLTVATGTSKTSLETQLIDALPLNARDANQLLRLVPGAVVDYSGNVHINGIDYFQNLFSLDGTDNRDQYNHTQTMAPAPDALKEFTVETNYSAEYGQGAGAAVLMTTKSGTNQIHGSFYDYFRSENLNANSFQANYNRIKKQELKRHQVGLTVGGPVLLPWIYDGRNKSFWFFSAQWLKVPSSPYLAGRGGLTAAERRGDFSQSKVIPKVSTTWANTPGSPFAGRAGQQITNLTPFLSPIALKYYEKFHDNREVPYSGFLEWVPSTQKEYLPEYVMRGDHTIGKKNTVTFTMFYKHRYGDAVKLNFDPESWRRSTRFKSQHYTLADVWTVNPRMVNELRVGYLRSWEYQYGSLPGDTNFDSFLSPNYAGNVGLEMSGGNSTYYCLDPSYFGFRVTAGLPLSTGRDLYDYNDTISFSKGNHFMKAGATMKLNAQNGIKSPQWQQYLFRGTMNGTGLGSDVAEWIIGWPTSANFRQGTWTPSARNQWSIYFQDDWKITQKLTLNLGLRYEPYYWGFIKMQPGSVGVMAFKPFAQSTVYPKWPSGLITLGDPDCKGRNCLGNDMNNVAPRVGFAYRLNDNGTKVLRGAYGLFFADNMPGNEAQWLAYSAFPFIHSYTANYNLKYPGGNDAFLDVPKYNGMNPLPDFGTRPDINNAVFTATTVYGGNAGLWPEARIGKLHQWNMTYEDEFRPGWLYSIGYQGHGSWKSMMMNEYWNLPQHKDSTDSWAVENMASRRPIQQYRYQTRAFAIPKGDSLYHALNLKATTRTAHFRMKSWYTWAYHKDNVDNYYQYGLTFHPGEPTDMDWGPAVHARTHKLMLIPSWDLPIFRDNTGWMGRIMGGWNATMVMNLQSGAHMEIQATNVSYECQSCYSRPDPVPGQPLTISTWRSDPKLVYVNVAAFKQPLAGTYGTVHKNPLPWPATYTTDMTLMKTFGIYQERVKFDLRADFFNLFNNVNWNNTRLGPIITSAASLAMTNYWTEAARTIQVSGRVTW